MREHPADSGPTLARRISDWAVQLYSGLVYCGASLAVDGLCTFIWMNRHPHRVAVAHWFGATLIAVVTVFALTAVVATVRVAQWSRGNAMFGVFCGIASGVFMFELNTWLT